MHNNFTSGFIPSSDRSNTTPVNTNQTNLQTSILNGRKISLTNQKPILSNDKIFQENFSEFAKERDIKDQYSASPPPIHRKVENTVTALEENSTNPFVGTDQKEETLEVAEETLGFDNDEGFDFDSLDAEENELLLQQNLVNQTKTETIEEKQEKIGEEKATVIEEEATVIEEKATVIEEKAVVVEEKVEEVVLNQNLKEIYDKTSSFMRDRGYGVNDRNLRQLLNEEINPAETLTAARAFEKIERISNHLIHRSFLYRFDGKDITDEELEELRKELKEFLFKLLLSGGLISIQAPQKEQAQNKLSSELKQSEFPTIRVVSSIDKPSEKKQIQQIIDLSTIILAIIKKRTVERKEEERLKEQDEQRFWIIKKEIQKTDLNRDIQKSDLNKLDVFMKRVLKKNLNKIATKSSSILISKAYIASAA